MKKFYVKEEDLTKEEKERGVISYARLTDFLFSDMVLCNNIQEVDPEIFGNIEIGSLYYYTDEDGNEYTEEEYDNDETGKIHQCENDIYQYFIVDLRYGDIEYIKNTYGDCVILAYSNLLDVYVLMVDHFGTSWKGVMTDIEYTTNLDEVL